MKHLSRFGIVAIALAMFGLAFAQSPNANTPPRDGCTFRSGTTLCQGYEYEFYGEFSTFYSVVSYPLCDSDGDGVGDAYSWYQETEQLADWYWTITTYRGNSSVVDEVLYREFVVKVGVGIETEYLGCAIERPDR